MEPRLGLEGDTVLQDGRSVAAAEHCGVVLHNADSESGLVDLTLLNSWSIRAVRPSAEAGVDAIEGLFPN